MKGQEMMLLWSVEVAIDNNAVVQTKWSYTLCALPVSHINKISLQLSYINTFILVTVLVKTIYKTRHLQGMEYISMSNNHVLLVCQYDHKIHQKRSYPSFRLPNSLYEPIWGILWAFHIRQVYQIKKNENTIVQTRCLSQ